MTGQEGVPFEPDAASRRLAKWARNFHKALVIEGFSEQQALHIVGVALAAGINRGQ